MKNNDLNIKKDEEIKVEMKEAIENGDSNGFVSAQAKLAKNIENRIMEEAKEFNNAKIDEAVKSVKDDLDSQAIAARGLQPLTSEERKFYNEVITTGGFAGAEELMPATIFDRVFENLRKEHALLSQIEFQNTTGVSEWITRDGQVEAAWWGKLTDAITKELSEAFAKERTGLFKLSAYIPVAKSMLDLGPQWLDRFVREVLYESLAIALEEAIVSGTGKDQPIGMIKDLDGAVVDGEYPDKTATALADFDPATLGAEIMAPLTKNGTRPVPEVIMIVNPLDYWGKIFPNTTRLTADGTYVYGVLPISANIIQSAAVPEGTMIAGVARDYFMGVGSTQKIDYSDHYKFLEDERTYIAKQYANGKPVDNESFLVFDISSMTVPQA